MRRLYRLDLPLWQQYLYYLQGLARGDFGPSFTSQDFNVGQLFAKGSAGFGAARRPGADAGARRRRHARRDRGALAEPGGDYAVVTAATAGITIPTFVTAPLFQVIFGLWLAWLPVGGWNDGAVRNVVLPVIVLALPQTAVVAA